MIHVKFNKISKGEHTHMTIIQIKNRSLSAPQEPPWSLPSSSLKVTYSDF